MNILIVPKNLKEGTPWDFLPFALAKYQKELRGNLLGTLEIFEKKSKSKKGGESQCQKIGNLLLWNACEKLAHTHRFEHETSGLKSKHLTTRPRPRGLCDLPREMRVVARKKSIRTFP